MLYDILYTVYSTLYEYSRVSRVDIPETAITRKMNNIFPNTVCTVISFLLKSSAELLLYCKPCPLWQLGSAFLRPRLLSACPTRRQACATMAVRLEGGRHAVDQAEHSARPGGDVRNRSRLAARAWSRRRRRPGQSESRSAGAFSESRSEVTAANCLSHSASRSLAARALDNLVQSRRALSCCASSSRCFSSASLRTCVRVDALKPFLLLRELVAQRDVVGAEFIQLGLVHRAINIQDPSAIALDVDAPASPAGISSFDLNLNFSAIINTAVCCCCVAVACHRLPPACFGQPSPDQRRLILIRAPIRQNLSLAEQLKHGVAADRAACQAATTACSSRLSMPFVLKSVFN